MKIRSGCLPSYLNFSIMMRWIEPGNAEVNCCQHVSIVGIKNEVWYCIVASTKQNFSNTNI
jgi:hypothetical protein